MHVRASVILFAALHVAGCATKGALEAGPPTRPQLGGAGSTSTTRAARDRPAGDDRVLGGSSLERGAFVRAVLSRNPSLEAARHGWRAATARARQAGSFEDPMLELGAAPLSIAPAKVPFGYEVAISQRLPWFGKRALEASVAAAEGDVAKSDYEGMRRQLALSALHLYDQYFVAQRSLEINAAHVRLMSAMRDSAVAQFGSGHGSAQDALQAEAELASMERQSLMLSSEREIIVAQMNELLHRDPELSLPPPPDELPAPPAIEAPTSRLEAEALQQRPELAAARQHVRAEQARAERAERDAYPDLTLSTSYNSMWEMPEHRWMVGVGLNLPLGAGKRSAMADEARAMSAQFESELERMTDMTRAQVFVATRRLRESRQVLRLMETRLLPVAREQIDAARAGFVTSQNAFLAVVAAEKNLRQVELDYEMARADYATRYGELERALGRIPGLASQELDR